MFRGQNENIHCCRNVVVVGGTVVFVFSIPIQQAENLQRIRSNRGSRLSPTISFVENNSPAKAGLVKGSGWGISIKGRRKPRIKKKPKNRAKTEKKTRAKQSIKKSLHREGNQFCHCFHPCRKRPTNQYPQKPAPSFVSFIISKSAGKTKADRGHGSKKGKQKERYQAGESHQQPLQPELRHRLQRL
jgi:hypothetical protein